MTPGSLTDASGRIHKLIALSDTLQLKYNGPVQCASSWYRSVGSTVRKFREYHHKSKAYILWSMTAFLSIITFDVSSQFHRGNKCKEHDSSLIQAYTYTRQVVHSVLQLIKKKKKHSQRACVGIATLKRNYECWNDVERSVNSRPSCKSDDKLVLAKSFKNY